MLLFLVFLFAGICLCDAIGKGLAATLLVLVILAIGIAILAAVLLLVTALTSSPACGWIAVAATALWECKCGYRIFYDH